MYFQRYFQELSDTGLFRARDAADRIVIIAIYMPIVRNAAYKYKDPQNIYKIRKQLKRLSYIARQLYHLYNFPLKGTDSYGDIIDPLYA